MPTPEEILDGRPYAVVEADCLEFLPTITGQVDHVITDPPYEAEAHTKQRRSLKDATQRRGAVNVGEVGTSIPLSHSSPSPRAFAIEPLSNSLASRDDGSSHSARPKRSARGETRLWRPAWIGCEPASG
jgi:hypothetical protein